MTNSNPRNPRDRRNKRKPRRERRPEDRHAYATFGELLKPEQKAALEELRKEL